MISFVIPAHNEAELLGRTLAALIASAQTVGEPWETVVVNDASTDRTAEIALAHGARIITVNHRQIAATRNAGAQAMTGEVLFFVDADTVVTLSAAERGRRHDLVRHPNYDLPRTSAPWRSETTSQSIEPHIHHGCVISFRTALPSW